MRIAIANIGVACLFGVLLFTGCDDKQHTRNSSEEASSAQVEPPVQTNNRESAQSNHLQSGDPGRNDREGPVQAYETRYESPEGAEADIRSPVGHTIVLAGYRLKRESREVQLLINDPADNINDGEGRHRWGGQRSVKSIDIDGEPVLEIGDSVAQIFAAVYTVPVPNGQTPTELPAVYTDTAWPDLSQHARPGWRNYCAPTCAAGIVSGFAKEFPVLLRPVQRKEGTNRDDTATRLIAGEGSPPPAVGSLARMMDTTVNRGTRGIDLVQALDRYLESYDGDVDVTWDTGFISFDEMPTEKVVEDLTRMVSQKYGVILLLHFVPGASGREETVASDIENGEEVSRTEANASSATSNSGRRESRTASNGSESEDDEDRGTSPQPMHKTEARGTTSSFLDELNIEGVPDVTPLYDELPDVTDGKEGSDSTKTGTALDELVGQWEQVGGDNSSDFAEGGYLHSAIQFTDSGLVIVKRSYDRANSVELIRRYRLEKMEQKELELKASAEASDAFLREDTTLPAGENGKRDVIVEPIDGDGPFRLKYHVGGAVLTLEGKTYRRVID